MNDSAPVTAGYVLGAVEFTVIFLALVSWPWVFSHVAGWVKRKKQERAWRTAA